MAEMKSRNAFGSLENVTIALERGLIDEFDILFFDEGKIGWIDKNKNLVIAEADTTELKTMINTLQLQVNSIENNLDNSSQETNTKIEQATEKVVEVANAYTDEQIANAISVIEF